MANVKDGTTLSLKIADNVKIEIDKSAIATIVAAHKGLHAKGGPKGVADAVTQSVVLSVILLALVNVGLTQAYVMLVPQKVA